uniref:AlNc14C206G8824 protein n=1 Tax=Albugo laibachii Nc14 TaxID=890382 RepID=F0WR16_9STRA|nr:AlNc14C206G8824 [Albugo laibachii Nc14]|eukprot:CCA23776.1 AlNc14C206G8824 [Albugo laibachii Nc14]
MKKIVNLEVLTSIHNFDEKFSVDKRSRRLTDKVSKTHRVFAQYDNDRVGNFSLL